MADEEHVILLKQGTVAWNAWREENPDIFPDLDSADLRNADLRSMNLTRANFSNANLRDAQLNGTNLKGASFRDANLSGANFSLADFSGAYLSRADFSDADLRHANFSQADLFSAHLRRANLSGSNFTGAYLSRTDFSGVQFSGANLSHAFLRDADLSRADLSKSKLCNADLRTSALIDTRLDGADLTGAKLWEAQRSGWLIKRIICKWVFWDRDGTEPTEYEAGAFERIFAEKPHIILRYAGGMSAIDLAMLPLIVERLQIEHPDSLLHIRSVQDDGSGATVTIIVEDLVGRSEKAFAQDVELMRSFLTTLQLRLHQEERLRLQAEASYRTMVEDVLPKLLNRTQPKTEVHIGQITGPATIEGTTMSKDTYNIHGQAGAVGKNAHAHDMIFQQVWNQSNIDLSQLAEELTRLRAAMKQETEGTREQDKAIVAVADAEEAAIKSDGPSVLQHLKTAGTWALGVAEKIGVSVAAEAIKRAM